jgi:hypothetical protein
MGGGLVMSFGQSILTALFMMVVVFSVLIALWGLISLSTIAIRRIEGAIAEKSQ